MTSTGMAIDPSLLFMQSQQQQQQQQQHGKGSSGEGSSNQKDADHDDEDRKPDVNGLTAQRDKSPQGDTAMESAQQVEENLSLGDQGDGAKPDMSDSAQDQKQQPEELPQTSEEDIALAKFLAKMDDYEPILPDAVTRYYLEKAGFQSSDVRVTRMLGLAAQKFVSDLAADAYAYARVRATTGVGRAPSAMTAAATQTTNSKAKDRTKTVLTLDDLSAALHEYGIDATRAPYYR